MKTGNLLLTTLSLAASLSSTQAADCGGYGVGSKGIGACTNRDGNWKDRDNFCSSLAGQGSWKRTCQNGRNSNKCHFEYQGPGMPWQLCYDAFENIINQCFGAQNGGGYHYGTYSYDNHWFVIDRCSA
ncbi:alpha-galactosyl-binding lectin [Fusarium beomiforme]|uniref:Alpha-galactosyl-binding lectin n=1 Tax=Fusarium beomiforme TaxID=44412 RepID=A0A9P5AKT0_9HYPO|nr:alpha-galactosyl-binding lectin [Fusarium beomiforme]